MPPTEETEDSLVREPVNESPAQEPSQAETAASKKKRKKKKKKSGSNNDSGSDNDSDASSVSSSGSVSEELSEEVRDAINKRFADVLNQASKNVEEIISLDNCYLKNKQLNKLLARLDNNTSVVNLVLTNNRLSDDACKSLKDSLLKPTFCENLLSIDLRGNKGITELGINCVKDVLISNRAQVQAYWGQFETVGQPDDSLLDALKAGAVITEEEPPHARPEEQWEALELALAEPKANISRISQVMRDICDAVVHEVIKEEAIDAQEAAATGGVAATRAVHLPPGQYCNFAASKLATLAPIFEQLPEPFCNTANRKPVAGVGSHRFHASALICQLVCCACDPSHGGAQLQQPLQDSNLLPIVAHLAFSNRMSSCMHSALLDAYSADTLPQMPQALWRPLLQDNLGAPLIGSTAKRLDALPKLLMQHASDALKKVIGQRSGFVGLIIQLGTVLQHACNHNAELKAALQQHEEWVAFTKDGGPLARLQAEQSGSLGGGKPSTSTLDGMYEDGDRQGSEEGARVLLGIREYSSMQQSLNLASALK